MKNVFSFKIVQFSCKNTHLDLMNNEKWIMNNKKKKKIKNER